MLFYFTQCQAWQQSARHIRARFVSHKKREEGAIFYLAKGGIFFRLFCLTNPAQGPRFTPILNLVLYVSLQMALRISKLSQIRVVPDSLDKKGGRTCHLLLNKRWNYSPPPFLCKGSGTSAPRRDEECKFKMATTVVSLPRRSSESLLGGAFPSLFVQQGLFECCAGGSGL
jgi:hypothetical protein